MVYSVFQTYLTMEESPFSYLYDYLLEPQCFTEQSLGTDLRAWTRLHSMYGDEENAQFHPCILRFHSLPPAPGRDTENAL